MPRTRSSTPLITDPAEIAALKLTVSPAAIRGVVHRPLTSIEDGRGGLTEVWSAGWKQAGLVQPKHVYQSATDYGVVKAWHLHRVHTDQFAVTRGKIQIVCVDLRRASPTRGRVNTFIFGDRNPGFLLIPPGILHGWKALSTPEAVVLNMQSHVYDPADELRLPWDAVLRDVWEPKFR